MDYGNLASKIQHCLTISDHDDLDRPLWVMEQKPDPATGDADACKVGVQFSFVFHYMFGISVSTEVRIRENVNAYEFLGVSKCLQVESLPVQITYRRLRFGPFML